ncbi:unnamed protein product [Dibothriocephalus latus]|uniref:Reverse transcriptase domain-containing protein n=1 Tax=Dibothriocephalus latus TaxID=60516 RepID=A0A3P7LLN1_DIBLA|nr:unnamed protein product [Dibothriocephalus latus]
MGKRKRRRFSTCKVVDKLKKSGALTRREALAAKATNTAMAHSYSLPKVHKSGVPLRPIVPFRGTPNFWVVKDSEWTVKSAKEFLTRIQCLEVEADEVMVSFYVISLLTSIPPTPAIEIIGGLLQEKYDESDQRVKILHIVELLELCLKTFFTFNGQVYEQTKGDTDGLASVWPYCRSCFAEARAAGLQLVYLEQSIVAIYVDLTKAFDKVPHKRLLVKLEAVGIRLPLLDFIGSYLPNHSQKILVGNIYLMAQLITSGVFQGAVLGPLLFILYINEISTVLKIHTLSFTQTS